MNSIGIWMLYSLFALDVNGERFVFEGKEFYSKQECISFSTKNITDLNKALTYRLDYIYGKNSYVVLELGCVQKDNPMGRKIILNNNLGKDV